MDVAKISFTCLPWIFVGGLAVLLIGKKTTQGTEVGKVDQAMPLVVEALKDTKFLHSAEMQMQETFAYTTHKQAADWAAMIPGVSNMVEKTTKNEVWVAAHGTVGAGVDLSKAKVSKSPTGITITIPKAEIEKPNVQLSLVSSKRGAFWDDRSITLKAERTAAERFQVAAAQQGLKDKAAESAKATLTNLISGVTSVPVEIKVEA